MLVYLSNHENKYDIKAKDCWAYDGLDTKSNKTKQIQLTDGNGCPIKSKLINYWSKASDESSQNTKLIYTNLTAFKFPEKEHVYLSCNIEVCYEECKMECLEEKSTGSNIKNIRLTRETAVKDEGNPQLRLPDLAVLLGFKQKPQIVTDKPVRSQATLVSTTKATPVKKQPLNCQPGSQRAECKSSARPTDTLCYLGSSNPACYPQVNIKTPENVSKRPVNRIYPYDPPECYFGSTDPRCPNPTDSPVDCSRDPQNPGCFFNRPGVSSLGGESGSGNNGGSGGSGSQGGGSENGSHGGSGTHGSESGNGNHGGSGLHGGGSENGNHGGSGLHGGGSGNGTHGGSGSHGGGSGNGNHGGSGGSGSHGSGDGGHSGGNHGGGSNQSSGPSSGGNHGGGDSHGFGSGESDRDRVKCYPGSNDPRCPILCWPGFTDIKCPILCCPGCPYNRRCNKNPEPSDKDSDYPPICYLDSYLKNKKCPKICYANDKSEKCDVTIPMSHILPAGQWLIPFPAWTRPDNQGPDGGRPDNQDKWEGKPDNQDHGGGRPDNKGEESGRPDSNGESWEGPNNHGQGWGRPDNQGWDRPGNQGWDRPGSDGPGSNRPGNQGWDRPGSERPGNQGWDRPGSERPGNQGWDRPGSVRPGNQEWSRPGNQGWGNKRPGFSESILDQKYPGIPWNQKWEQTNSFRPDCYPGSRDPECRHDKEREGHLCYVGSPDPRCRIKDEKEVSPEYYTDYNYIRENCYPGTPDRRCPPREELVKQLLPNFPADDDLY